MITARLLRRIELAALTAIAIVAVAAPAATAAEPIEGSWFLDGGEILVEPSGAGTFVGTVVRPTLLANCVHPVGERIWTLSGAGSRYSGTHQWFKSAGCVPNPGGQTTWDVGAVRDGRQTVRMCTRNPDVGGPPTLDAAGEPADSHTRCFVLERARRALPRPTFRGVVVLPRPRATVGCGPRRRVRVVLRQPVQDPLVAAVVRVNGKVVRRVSGAALRRPLVLRGLPRKRIRIAVVVNTASGKVLRGNRTLRACPRPRAGRRPVRAM